MISAMLFVFAAGVLCIAVVLAVIAVTHLYYLTTSRAIMDDGMFRGAVAPTWALADSSGVVVRSPPASKPFQLVVFTDHSLKSFPPVAQGLLDLLRTAPELEIVILMRHPSDIAGPVFRVLGLGEIPVLIGSSALYGRYNVRVMPFVIFVDSEGRVRASSLVNSARQVERLWRLANVALGPAEVQVAGRQGRRPAQAGV
jgi:hypothetical protein